MGVVTVVDSGGMIAEGGCGVDDSCGLLAVFDGSSLEVGDDDVGNDLGCCDRLIVDGGARGRRCCREEVACVRWRKEA